MGNNQSKKQAAIEHNRKRIEAHVERVRIEQDKIDNPEKYARRNRKALRRAMPFIASAVAIYPNAFDKRLLK